MPEIDLLQPTCMPGQLDTEADYRLPVVLFSPSGSFGVQPGTVALIAENKPGVPVAMDPIPGCWTPHAIAARFSPTNPGNEDTEHFTVRVRPATGSVVDIAPVEITGPAGHGWPPTHDPSDREMDWEPIGQR